MTGVQTCALPIFPHAWLLYYILSALSRVFCNKICNFLQYFSKKFCNIAQRKCKSIFCFEQALALLYIVYNKSPEKQHKKTADKKSAVHLHWNNFLCALAHREFQLIGNHCDEFGVCRLASLRLDCVAEIRGKDINIASVPSNLYCMTDCTLNS